MPKKKTVENTTYLRDFSIATLGTVEEATAAEITKFINAAGGTVHSTLKDDTTVLLTDENHWRQQHSTSEHFHLAERHSLTHNAVIEACEMNKSKDKKSAIKILSFAWLWQSLQKRRPATVKTQNWKAIAPEVLKKRKEEEKVAATAAKKAQRKPSIMSELCKHTEEIKKSHKRKAGDGDCGAEVVSTPPKKRARKAMKSSEVVEEECASEGEDLGSGSA